MKHLALTIMTTLATLAVILLIWQLRSIFLLFLFSLIIAATLRSPIEHLIHRGLKRWLAMSIMYGLMVIGLAALLSLLALPLALELDTLAHDLAQLYERGYGLALDRAGADSALLGRLPSVEAVGQLLLENQPAVLAKRVLGFTQGFAFLIGQAILGVVLSIYWAADQLHFERLWLSLLAPEQRTRMRDLWYQIEENVGAYVRSEVLQSIIAGALLTLGFDMMGLTYPFLMAAIGAIAWFIPLVGALFAVPLIVLLALLNGLWLAVAAAIYTLLIFGIMEFVLEPRLYDRSKYGVLLVIVVMMAMVDALGLTGLLLAPPLALTLQIILDELLAAPVTPTPAAAGLSLNDLEKQLAEVRAIVDRAETQSPRVANLVNRLEQLVQESQEATT